MTETTFTNATSDFLKLVEIPDNKKPDYIDFAATDFASLRQSIIDYLKAVYPLDYQNYIESDLGIMLVEIIAYMGAVMSMKADMLASENFLSTAKNRNNVRKLLELIGVSMRGPIGAAANATLTLDSSVSPLTASGTEITIPRASRVVTINSPEDGGPLTYTLYKITNGRLVDPRLESDVSLDVVESNDTSAVWSNLVMLEGSFVRTTGTFKNTQATKKIPLTESPVIQDSVEVYIDTATNTSGAWTRVDNIFFASGATDRVYQVVYDDNFKATVVFGDGVVGQSPEVGASYVITYRVGGGTRGNINSEVINATVTLDDYNGSPLFGQIENSSQATGGQDAETVEHAKKYAPLTFRRQDRLVTLEDFTTFANTFVGSTGATGKARAVTREGFSSANNIDVYTLQKASALQLQQATTAFKAELLEAMNDKKMLTDEIAVVDGVIRTLDLVMTVNVDKELEPKEELIKNRVRNEIVTYFAVDNFDFGRALILADLNRAVFTGIDEVRYSTIDNLAANVLVDFNEIIQLNNIIINVAYV